MLGYERCEIPPRTGGIEHACNCNNDFQDFSSSCEVFMEIREGGHPHETRDIASMTCKENVSQRCKDRISEMASIVGNAPNVNTCKEEDPTYNLIMNLAKDCNPIP